MKKALIDHQNMSVRLVDMDDVDKKLYFYNNKETNTIADITTSFQIQQLIQEGYIFIQDNENRQ